MKSKTAPKPVRVRVWTWQMDQHLCRFAESSRKLLEDGGKPSPEAKSVRVVMLTEGEYQRLLKHR